MILQHTVSYDLTLPHIDLYGKVNDEGVYQYFVTGNNTSTLHCYQVHKKEEAKNYHKVNTGCFWSNSLYNPFTQRLGLEAQFESGDTKDDSTKNKNNK